MLREKTRERYDASYLRRVLKSVADRGVIKTLRLVKEERWHEIRLGVQTSGIIHPQKLQTRCANRTRAYRYEAVNDSAFKAAVSVLKEPLSDYSFIDLGCGKGFALMLAARYGFRTLIGVEFSPELTAVCRRNMTRFYESQRGGCRPPFEVLDLDVTQFVLPPGKNVLFLFNPFDEVVMRETFSMIKAGLSDADETLYVIYVNALHRQVLSDVGFTLIHFNPTDPLRVYQNGIAVFRS